MTADDTSQDITGQTHSGAGGHRCKALEVHGTDKTRMLQAQIWVKDIRDRDAMNKVWIGLGSRRRRARPAPASRLAWRIPACWSRS